MKISPCFLNQANTQYLKVNGKRTNQREMLVISVGEVIILFTKNINCYFFAWYSIKLELEQNQGSYVAQTQLWDTLPKAQVSHHLPPKTIQFFTGVP